MSLCYAITAFADSFCYHTTYHGREASSCAVPLPSSSLYRSADTRHVRCVHCMAWAWFRKFRDPAWVVARVGFQSQVGSCKGFLGQRQPSWYACAYSHKCVDLCALINMSACVLVYDSLLVVVMWVLPAGLLAQGCVHLCVTLEFGQIGPEHSTGVTGVEV
jgi:hypothetical protein